MRKIWLAVVLIVAGSSARAQERETIGKVIGALGAIMADGKARRELAAVSQPLVYDSQVPALDQADATDPRNVDVAGLRLGMTPAEARRALQRAGFSIAEEHKQWSYAMRVFPNANLAQDVHWWGAHGRNDQRLTVKFASLPEGAVVNSIEFAMFGDTMTQEAFVAQLGRKYGEAELVLGEKLVWCVGPTGRCPDENEWRDQPHLIAEPSFRSIQLLFVDPARDEAFEVRVRSVVEGQKPKVERADF